MPDTIDKTILFNGLSDKQFADLFKKGRQINLRPKRLLFHQGDPAKNCYFVDQGRLKLTKLNEQGREVILRFINTGELTGAVTVLKDRTYPVTAESIGETKIIAWDKPTMMQLMQRYPEIAINLLGIVLERLDDVQNRYLELCTEQVDRRIARTLLRLMRRVGSKTPEGIRIDIPLSRQNIADYSGTTLYTVSRTLSTWQKKGWVHSKREQILITDVHALVQFTETG